MKETGKGNVADLLRIGKLVVSEATVKCLHHSLQWSFAQPTHEASREEITFFESFQLLKVLQKCRLVLVSTVAKHQYRGL